jgi:hypothetical protein
VPRGQYSASRFIEIYTGKAHNCFVCIKDGVMDRLEVLKHYRSPFIGVASKVVLPVKGMKQSVALKKRVRKLRFKGSQRICGAMQAF